MLQLKKKLFYGKDFVYSLVGVGMAMGRGGAGPKDGIFAPAPHGFLLPHPRSAPHDGENFLPHPRPLRPHEDPQRPALPRKTLFLINFPYNYYHFFK